ncbi:MAG: ParB/RepB/Spo0J family partition protein [Hyphomicrobiales bacterium]|nr:ParB/RepB/Spo0J family partition protein [Hyphomicrobiales bacterium]
MPTELSISQLRTDGGTQPRAALDFEAVDDYADAMADGAKFPPVVVYYDGENYWLADGFHRVKAAWQAGRETITAEVRSGTLEEARWHSFSANRANGLRRTNDDKQRAVKGALQHPRAAELSDREIARHVGVNHDTVSAWRKKLSLSVGIRQIDSRTVTRKGTTYQQDTSTIGRRSRVQAPRPSPHEIQSPAVPAPDPEMRAFARALKDLTVCQLPVGDFVSWLVAQTEAAELIPLLENSNAIISEILSEIRRSTVSARKLD